MDISSRQEGSATIVTMTGAVDTLGAPEANAFVSKTIESGQVNLVLDLSGVTFISSAGVGMLLNAIKLVRKASGDIRLAALPRNVHKVLDFGGITTLLQIFEDVASAARSFSG